MAAGWGKLGSGWLMVWQVATVLGFFPCVAAPAALQSMQSLDLMRGRAPFDLEPVVLIGTIALYFFVIGVVNGVLIAKAMGAHWIVASLLGLAAACGQCVMTGTLVHELVDVGGWAWVVVAWMGLIALLVINLGAPRWAGCGDTGASLVGEPEVGI